MYNLLKMASEAQRLIGISLTKIAQSRTHRGGVSLHKNLLVATVLHKARYIFMEEAYNMVHYHQQQRHQALIVENTSTIVDDDDNQKKKDEEEEEGEEEEEELVGLTAEEAPQTPSLAAQVEESATSTTNLNLQQTNCQEDNKENQPINELTYLDLDISNSKVKSSKLVKRRRSATISELETEEAIASILPKRIRNESDDVTSNTNGGAMEIDRITSLVSIFSFAVGNSDKSCSDLCSTQAKDDVALQHQNFLTMTV